jgi:hypothetical protein
MSLAVRFRNGLFLSVRVDVESALTSTSCMRGALHGSLLRSMAKLHSNLHCGCLRKNAEVTFGSERTGLSGFSRAIFAKWRLAIPGPASKILRHTTSTQWCSSKSTLDCPQRTPGLSAVSRRRANA